MSPLFILLILLLYSLFSIYYVFKFRGQARYHNFNEYIRKGWPIFTPLNCILYVFTKPFAKCSIISPDDYDGLNALIENWPIFKEEALKLHKAGILESPKDPSSQAHYDLGFRTFYKYGWSKFYLTWYGTTLKSAIQHCPRSLQILKDKTKVKGAMFSILPPGAKLTRHLDPVASSLRFHLGLSTPNHDDCFINVDGKKYSWRDGEPFIFDETFLHFAHNDTDKDRIILMCDIERPMFFPGKVFNFIYQFFLKASLVPNLPGDQRGSINKIFSALAPLLAKTKTLKHTNRPLYLCLKHSVNLALIVIFLLLIWSSLKFVLSLTQFT